MRRLSSLMILAITAAGATGCQTAPQPCCRPVQSCSPCGPSLGSPMMGGQMIESYGAPTLQATPGTIVPGTVESGTLTPSPQTYTPSMP